MLACGETKVGVELIHSLSRRFWTYHTIAKCSLREILLCAPPLNSMPNASTVNADSFESDYVSKTPGIMIGGSGRSGTTLLRVMLDSHRNLCCGPESYLFVPIKLDWGMLAHKFEMDLSWVDTLRHQVDSRAELIDKFFSEYCRITGKQRWAEKTPRNIEQLGFIFSGFPNSRFIHIIRDGRDVACSLRTHPRYKVEGAQFIKLNTWNPLPECIERWRGVIKASQPFRSDPRYMEVRYEDLTAAPKATLEKVLPFVDEPWDENILSYHEVHSASRDVAKFPQNIAATEPITTRATGRWKQDFSEDDKAIFKLMAGDILIELGYESSDDW